MWNINMLDLLVDLLLGDGFCIVCLMILDFSTLTALKTYRACVFATCCVVSWISLTSISSIFPASEIGKGFDDLSSETLLYRVLRVNLGDLEKSSSTTCGTGALITCSSVCCCVLFWETVFGNVTNCSTISGERR